MGLGEHGQLLARLLEMSDDRGYNDRRKQIERDLDYIIPQDRTLSVERKDGTRELVNKREHVRELLVSDALESSTLVQEEVYRTLVEGAKPFVCFRNVLPVINTRSNQVRVNLGSSGAYAQEVAEGTEVPIGHDVRTARTYTVKKYATRPEITNEIMRDGLFDVAALEVAYAGARLENTLNHHVLGTLLDNAGNEHDCTGSSTGISAINSAMALNLADNFMSDAVVAHPAAYAKVTADYLPITAYFQAGGTYTTGATPTPLGMSMNICSTTSSSSTYTWNYGTDSYIGMLVLDSKNAGFIFMNEDVTVMNYDDPIRDLQGMTVKMRFGFNYNHSNAICRVEY